MANETYTLIQKTTLNASAASITFSSIPQTFTDLVVKVSGRSASASNQSAFNMNINSSSSGYTYKWLYGLPASGTAGSTGASDSVVGYANGSTATANTFGSAEIYIPNYTSSNYKSASADAISEGNVTDQRLGLVAYLWANTAAITSLSFVMNDASNWSQYTSISLYGVAKEGVTPVAGPKASGGDIITNDGTYWIHQFLNSGTFTPSQSLSTEYLVIAGGGGGAYYGGGGGAGGYRTASGFSTTAQSYAITVGAGGVGRSGAGNTGYNGSTSTFSTISASGGGGGGANSGGAPAAGGSGGGAPTDGGNYAGAAGNPGGYSPVEGYAGGANNINSPYPGGGGGGAGGVGGSASGSTPGNGGVGRFSSITGTSIERAGGGGASTIGGGFGTGTGGGGRGSYAGDGGTAGETNTGGGAGGGQNTTGKNGGSGIVIIRYAI